MTISKPTLGATGWNTATDALIDAVNAAGTIVAGLGNGTTDDRAALAAADTTAAATGLSVILPPGTYRVGSNLTITSPVVMRAGAVLKPDNGVTVLLTGGVDAPRKKIFDQSAGGVVAPKKVDYYHPAWWGATGGSDDTAAWTGMAAAITAAKVTDVSTVTVDFGQRILAPAGVNQFFGVTLANCHLVADKGVSIFYPSGTPTSGSMLTTGLYTTITGGFWRTNGTGQAVTLLDIQGARTQVENVYLQPIAANSIAISVGTGPSITPVLRDIRINPTNQQGTGIYCFTSDLEASNVWIGNCNIGINFQRSAARFSNLHIWGCNTGMSGSPDDCQFTNVFLDSNLGWGIDWTNCDRNIINGFTAWNNGAAASGTGGIHLQQTGGSACKNNIISNGVFDDNTGVGLLLDGACTGTEVQSVRIASRTVDNSGGAAVCTYGIQLNSSVTNTRLQLRGNSTACTTGLVNDLSTGTSIEFVRTTRVLAGDQTFTSNTSLATVLSIPVGTNEKWVIDGVLIVDGGQTGDLKARLQATAATGSSGWFGFLSGAAGSAASTSAVSVNPNAYAAIAVTGGATPVIGTVGASTIQPIGVTGYLTTSTTAGTLDLQAAQSTSDATTLTIRTGSWLRATRIA